MRDGIKSPLSSILEYMHWAAAMLFAGSQVLSPPRDGEIRVEYSDLLRQTVVSLALTIAPPQPSCGVPAAGPHVQPNL